MRDVAVAAQVSVQTVSNVVNNRQDLMTPETRRRVEEHLVRLGYYPNSHARTLRSKRTRSLGLLILDPESRFLADIMTDVIVAGIGDIARDRGYSLLIQAGRPTGRQASLFEPVLEQRVDGIFMLLSGPSSLRRWYVREALDLDTKVVLFEADHTRRLPSVTAANREGAIELVQHLAAKGHTRIAFLASKVEWPMVEERFAGYCAGLDALGIERDTKLELFDGAWTADNGRVLVRRLLELDLPPTAIMAGNDLLALGVIEGLRSEGKRVPGDIAVTGFNDFEFAAFTTPKLTTVRVPGYEMGRIAANLLIDQTEGRPVEPAASRMLPVDLCIRESS
jgi:DNA-binding LacI/PurR family transcriptional regulator